MKGGFGKFLTFILGLVVGVLLVGGTIAGVVYYAVAAVSVNDVENYTKQEFTFIDKDAEIRNKSILDIYDMVKGNLILRNIPFTILAPATLWFLNVQPFTGSQRLVVVFPISCNKAAQRNQSLLLFAATFSSTSSV